MNAIRFAFGAHMPFYCKAATYIIGVPSYTANEAISQKRNEKRVRVAARVPDALLWPLRLIL